MSTDIWLGILFGGIALLAQYLPAKWGIPIGLVVVGLSLWQLGWGGWPLWLSIALLSLVAWRIFLHRGVFEKEKSEKKEQARQIHNRIIELDNQLENTKAKLSTGKNWQQDPEVRNILDKLQMELNNLGYLINNRNYDRWAEALMRLYSHELEFHKRANGLMDKWGNARINAKLRDFINKVKG